MLERIFHLRTHNTNIRTEIIAGVTTFLTMAYIIFVNPQILATAGMDANAVFMATCLAAAIGCFIMGFFANLPVALAPGMGLNAFFTYSIVLDLGYSWQAALGCVFLSGLAFVLISIFKIRYWFINAIPDTLKKAIAAGIGAFLAFVALKSANIIVANPATFVSLGDLRQFDTAMATIGFFLIIAVAHYRLTGGVTLVILLLAAIGVVVGITDYSGIVAPPPSIAATFLQLDLQAAFNLSAISVIFALFFVDLFDTAGTLIGVTQRAGLMKNGEVPNLKKSLLADSLATMIGALLGTSNTTSYVESTSGVAAGGRTGLVAVTTGVLFLLATFFSPLAKMIPPYATAGVIFYVAVLMLYTLGDIDWSDLSEAAPVAVVVLTMPLTYSIAEGITLGFISYTFCKIVTGKYRQINISVFALTIMLLAKVIFL